MRRAGARSRRFRGMSGVVVGQTGKDILRNIGGRIGEVIESEFSGRWEVNHCAKTTN